MRKAINKKAFTMLELVFVIVIMGFIGKFGVDFLAQAYNSFIFSKINNELQSNSSYAVEFIAKRLEHRIKESTIVRNTTAGTITELSMSNDANADVLEWIASDIDGFRGSNTTPNWSAIIDIDAGNPRLVSPESNITAIDNLIKILSNDAVTGINKAAIYFVGSPPSTVNAPAENNWGYNGAIINQTENIHPIQNGGANNEFLPRGGTFVGKEIFEFFKLTWTAYAVSLSDYNATTNLGNLTLHYDYQPWNNDTYLLKSDGTQTKTAIIMEDISAFRFRAAGSLIKIQVCAKSDLTNREYALCKEKTIY